MGIYIVKIHQNIDLTWMYFTEWRYTSIKLTSGISLRHEAESLDNVYEAGTHPERSPTWGPLRIIPPSQLPVLGISVCSPTLHLALCPRGSPEGTAWMAPCPWSSCQIRQQQEVRGRGQGVAAGRQCPWTEGRSPLKAALSGWLSLLGCGNPPIVPPSLSLHCAESAHVL